jgi:hypothetical protein
MKRFKVEIDTVNAAFGEDLDDAGRELARILRRLADEVEDGTAWDGPGTLRDVNGNSVGNIWYDTLLHGDPYRTGRRR